MTAGRLSQKTSYGFTLIELLVTVAVIVIVSTIAVPNFQSLITSNRAASDFNEILSGLNYARAEAIKCRGDVTFEITNGNGWSYSVTSVPCDIRELQRSSQSGTASSETIIFDALGKSDCAPGTACEITAGNRVIYIYSTGYIGRLNDE